MYTRIIHRPRELRPRHSVESQWDLLAGVDDAFAVPPDPERDRVEMPVEADARARVRARLAALGSPDEARLVVLHVSAGNPFRRWPETAFAALASRLAADDDRRWIVVTSGPSDREAARRVIAEARARTPAAAPRLVEIDDLSLVCEQYHAEEQVGTCTDPAAVVAFDRYSYLQCPGDVLDVRVLDAGAAGAVQVTVESEATGDSETFTIAGAAPHFTASLPWSTGDGPRTHDGILLVANNFQTGFDQPLLCGMYVDKRLAGIQAVQTLSRLNRAHPGKDTTFVVDFVNDPDEVLAAFKTYYDTAKLSAATDPDIIHSLRSKLDGAGHYDDEQIDRVVAVILGPSSKQGALDAAISPQSPRRRR